MPEEWFVRVQEKEYGPVDLDTLREWKSEGRLLATNPVRPRDETTWTKASEIVGLFDEPSIVASSEGDLVRRRTFGEIMSETFRIYAKGFPQFFALALLVALPSLGLKLSLAYVHYPDGDVVSRTTQIASTIAILMLTAVLVSWPIFLGGLQFAAHDLALGSTIRLGDILRRAINLWPRLARLSLVVYGSYLFWTVLPVLIILAVAGAPSIPSILIALLALAFQVYMAGRLFINFLFWQQTCTIGGRDGADALRESKELARSRKEAPPLQRPAYRGAIIASIWLVVLIALSVAVEMPFLIFRLQGVTNFEDAYALAQKLVNAPAPDAMTIATYVLSNLVHAALRPLLGIAFVVLYFDAKAGERRRDVD